MINSFLSLNLTFAVVLFISTLFLFIGIFYSKKKFSLNTYLVSERNERVFNLSATLIASSLGAWILFGPPTAATWGGVGSIIGYALGTAFPMILLIFFGKKIRLLLPKGKSLTELVLKKFGKNLFKLIFSLMIFYLFIFLCAEVTAISKLIYYISGLNIWISASIILFFTLTYVLFGGLKATIRSDSIQFVVIILLFFYLIFSVFLKNNNNLNLNIFQKNFIKFDSKSLISSLQFGFVFFIAVAATNLFHQGNWQRVYAAKNEKILVKSLIISFFIIFLIVLFMGIMGSISKLNGLKFNEDLAFFSIILNQNDILISLIILIFSLCLTISTVDTLLNSISSLTIVHSKDFFNFKYLKDKKLSNVVLILLSIICLIIALYQFSVLYLFLLADLLCCACVYVIFKGLYQKKINSCRSLTLIMIGLCSGLLFFPSTDFSKSLLVGVILDKINFNEIFTNSLMFWSFLAATLSPLIVDLIEIFINSIIKKRI
ncbi:MAG: sodium:solute symporter family transporter [Candidatus Fonsibacter lacus]